MKALSDIVQPGEKFGCICIGAKVSPDIKDFEPGNGIRLITETGFPLPDRWQDWIGSTRAHELERSNLLALLNAPSETTGVLNEEDKAIHRRLNYYYYGLMLSCRFSPLHEPALLIGYRDDTTIALRQISRLPFPRRRLFRPYPALEREHFCSAIEIEAALGNLADSPPPGGAWRLNRTIELYADARVVQDMLDTVHQFCRCIEGLILPKAGDTKRQFKSRTELFIGPKHHDLMGEIYDVRSAAEHLHESKYLEGFDRQVRLNIVRYEAIAEFIARAALSKIVQSKALREAFANTSSLSTFWALSVNDRHRIWGDPIDPCNALDGFDPNYIHDGLLGRA